MDTLSGWSSSDADIRSNHLCLTYAHLLKLNPKGPRCDPVVSEIPASLSSTSLLAHSQIWNGETSCEQQERLAAGLLFSPSPDSVDSKDWVDKAFVSSLPPAPSL